MKVNLNYAISRGVGYGLLGGFIGAIILGAIAYMMPINGVPFFVAGAMMLGIMGPIGATAGWMMHLITGLIIGAIFGIAVTKVRQLQVNNIGKGLWLGAVAGIIVWIIFFVPMASALASSMHMSLMSMGVIMIGGSFIGHVIFGMVMGGIVGVLLPKSSKSYKCDACGATFGSREELGDHGKMHMKSKQMQKEARSS